jgi:uncharacterized protein with GYD domain
MPKFLLTASYTVEGVRGLMKEGGTSRRRAAEEAIKSAGGTMEAFYFAFGDNDAVVILDAPDNAAAVSASATINASGAVRTKTVVLITPDEMDQATKKKVSYRPPGQ